MSDDTTLDVGFLATGWVPDRGGIPSHTDDLARALAARGHRVAVLCLDTTPGLEPFGVRESTVKGVRVRRVAYGYGDHEKLMDLMVHLRLSDVVLGWLAETPCDVVHVHHVTGFGGSAIRAVHEVGQPLVVTLHDYWLLDPRGQLFSPERGPLDPSALGRLAEELQATWPHLFAGHALDDVQRFRAEALGVLTSPDAVLTPSAAARAVFERAGVPEGRIRVVENGVAAKSIATHVAALRQRRKPREAVVLGVLGSVLPSKGVVELAEAVADAEIANLVLRVHGDLVPYHGYVEHLARLGAIAAKCPAVELAGPFERSDVAHVLAELDGVAAPSLWEEVYGLSVREARAAGLPVLVSDAGGLPATVEDGGGLVVPRGDREAWIAALRRFAGAERETWATAPAKVRTVEDAAAEIESVYRDAILRRTGAARASSAGNTKPLWKRLFGR
ncbi:MAG: glycosyltransferase [Planctomycetota bacterium]